jgi:protein O-mannosyl-transferase
MNTAKQRTTKRDRKPLSDQTRAKTNSKKKGLFESIHPAYLYLGLAGLVFIIYFQTFSFGYTGFDDTYLVTDNIGVLKDIANIRLLFTQDVFLGKQELLFYRPIQVMSYMIDTVIGGPTPSSYHVSNVIIHALTVCALLYALFLLEFRKLPSFLFAALFAAHPVFVQSLSWIPSRGDLLIGLFGTTAFIFYLKYLEKGSILFFLPHAILFFLSIFSKETAVLLPLLFLFYAFLTGGGKTISRKIIAPAVLWGLILLFWFILRNKVIHGGTSSSVVGFLPLISNLRAIPELLSKIFVPIGLAPMPVFTIAGILSGSIALVCLLVWAVYTKRFRDPRVLFGLAWFLALLLPGLWYKHALGAGAYDYLTHRLYFPSIGIIIVLLALGSSGFFEKKKAFVLLGVVILLAFCVDSAVLAGNYAGPMKFYDYAIRINPGCALAYNNRGNLYRMAGEYKKAMSDLDEAVRLLPSYPEPYHGKGAVYYKLGDILKAEDEFSKALQCKADYYDALNGRGLTRNIRGNRGEALSDFTEAIRVRPTGIEAYINRGNVFTSLGKSAEAEADYETALRLQPDLVQALMGLGGIRAASGKTAEAMNFFTKAVQADPNSADGYNGRAWFKYSLKDYTGAIADLNTALRVAPYSLESLVNRSAIYEGMGDLEHAMEDLSEVIRISPGNGLASNNRGVIRYKKGDNKGACGDWMQAAKLGIPEAAQFLQQYCK